MAYGDHVDNAVHVVERGFMRADLSVTVFLSAPEEYDGGELVVESDNAGPRLKLPLGHAVIYGADTLHHVTPVTRGSRLAAVTWIESLVSGWERREIVSDLAATIESIDPETQGGLRMRLERTRANLLRLWTNP